MVYIYIMLIFILIKCILMYLTILFINRIKGLQKHQMEKRIQISNLPKKKIQIYQKDQQIHFSGFVKNKGQLYLIKLLHQVKVNQPNKILQNV